jgi:large subunit ribosomal protein L35
VPKLKTRKGAAKRFKVTGSGKIRRSSKSFRNHILTKKSSKRKRKLRNSATVDPTDAPRLESQIPYR